MSRRSSRGRHPKELGFPSQEAPEEEEAKRTKRKKHVTAPPVVEAPEVSEPVAARKVDSVGKYSWPVGPFKNHNQVGVCSQVITTHNVHRSDLVPHYR